MRYLLVIIDGAADHPHPDLDGQTPLMAARTPRLDDIARRGRVGAVQTVPEGMDPGSDVAIMSLLGYDPAEFYTGRGPLEAASIGVDLNRSDVAFRANLVSTDGERMVDYSSGHIETEVSRPLIEFLGERLGDRKRQFYPGVGYRHLMVWRDGPDGVKCTPPHNIAGEEFRPHLPEGDGAERLVQMMYDSYELLSSHRINRRRAEEGLPPANMLWFWAPGRPPAFRSFALRHGRSGAVVAAVDLVKGLGRLAGLHVPDVPGATGYLNTDYAAKGAAALRLLRDHDFVCVHIEAPDEAGHQGNLSAKVEAIERIDEYILGPLLDNAGKIDDFRILVTPDHPTPVALRKHVREPVPFVVAQSGETGEPFRVGSRLPYDESAVEETRLRIDEGWRLLDETLFS
jgi:2,3-bisphosphoglycerate-independent phosphoglycerate mutase